MPTAGDSTKPTAPITLVCFAVKEEAKFFTPPPNVRVLITGMGRHNAFNKFDAYLAREKPAGVLTCGFAGGLDPALNVADILYDVDEGAPWEKALLDSKAKLARFECAARVSCTAREKFQLWQVTGKDAVEMESDTIRQVCLRNKIPSATIRVISDTVHEDLPLDFNRILTPDHRIDFAKLTARLLLKPRLIAQLLKFQGQTITAAQSLGAFLQNLLASSRDPKPSGPH
jgi:adenosylhomocysteine nucleosidase